jgi:Tfp pilus assembly protein PilV
MTGEHRAARRDGGFVLLEAAIAIALIMVVMTAVTSLFVAAMKVGREQQSTQVAAQIATSGMALVHSVRGPALTNGRDEASSTTQWNTLTPAVTSYLTGSVMAWDRNAATGSGPTAILPTTPQDTTVRGLPYHMSWYIGSCWQPAAGGDCGPLSTGGAVPMYRVVVAVTWTDTSCANALCTYADATLASSVATDPVFNPGSATAPPSTPTGPLDGTPAPLPGTVEAEAYDLGGQGVGYSVTSPTTTGAYGYRNDSVNLESTSDSSGTYDLAWTAAGQWQKYTVNAPYAGAYTVAFRVASPSAVTDAFHLTNAAGTNLTGDVNLPATGSYSTWGTVTVAATVTLVAGVQTLTLDQDHSGWSLNFIVFGATENPYSGTATPIPGTVEAENYDYGGQGLGYNLNSPALSTNYRIDGADIEGTSDIGGGYDLGWTGGGQWLRYTVNVATAGTYTVAFRVATGWGGTGAFHLANSGGTNLSGNVNLPATGGWQTWSTVTTTVSLPAGKQTLTLVQDTGGWNLNYMTFN